MSFFSDVPSGGGIPLEKMNIANGRSIGRQSELQNRLGVTTEYDAVSGVGEVAENGADALDWLLRDERSSLVRDAVDRLPELDAQVLLLKYEHDYNYTQIAERLGISRSAVQSRLHRARRKKRMNRSRSFSCPTK